MLWIHGLFSFRLELLLLHQADVNAQALDGLSPLIIVSAHVWGPCKSCRDMSKTMKNHAKQNKKAQKAMKKR